MITTANTNSHPPPTTDRPATQLVRSITGNDYVSWSQINSFRGCPRKYEFLYIDRAHPDFIATALHFGGAMHSAFEALFIGRLEGRGHSGDELFDIFMAKWAERRPGDEDVPLKFNQKEDPSTVFDMARRMLTAFHGSSAAQPEGQIVAVEEQLRLALDPDVPDVLCRVDLIWENPDAMHLVDFKTSRGSWSQEKADASAEQLLLYQHMAKLRVDGCRVQYDIPGSEVRVEDFRFDAAGRRLVATLPHPVLDESMVDVPSDPGSWWVYKASGWARFDKDRMENEARRALRSRVLEVANHSG